MVTEPRVKGVRSGGRNARVLRSIERATVDELVERGYAGLTIESIAARAGVHRTTIYRRWPDRRALVLHALLGLTRDELPIPDTGDFVRDMVVFGEALNEYLARPYVRTILATAITATEDFAELCEQFWSRRLMRARDIVRRARERGEVASDCRESVPIDMLAGPIYMRRLIQDDPMSGAEIEEMVRLITAGIVNDPVGG